MKSTQSYLSLFFILMIQTHEGLTQVNHSENELKSVRIGYFDTPPLSFINNDNQPDGFIVDLLNEIASLENFKITWVHDDFPQLMAQMKSKQLDALVSTAYSDERALFLDYSKLSFSNVWGQVFLPGSSNIESVFDLEGKTIALMENDFNGQNFINQCDQFDVSCNVVFGKSYQQIFSMLADNQVDAAVSNNMVGADFQDQYNLLASSIVFNPFKVYISSPKGSNSMLIDHYDRYMQAWKADKTSFYFQTRMKWTDSGTPATLPFWLIYTILGLIVFGLVSIVAAILFKRQVNRRVTELTQKEIQLNQIINILPHMIFANDYQGNIILVNDYACRFLDIDDQDVEKKNIYAILKSESRFKNLISYTTSSNPFNTEVEVRDSNDKKMTLMMSKVPYSGRNDTEPAMVTVGFDISQAKQYEEEIEYLAHHDALTGLPNRILLSDRLKSSLSRAKQFNHVGAIIYIDLDNFKNINDSQGHKVGDKLIKKVSTIIKKCVQAGDTIARQGGDEFVIELPELDTDFQLAEKQALDLSAVIISQLKKPILIEKKQYNITASVGLVIYPRDGEKQSILLQRADTAMNEAKQLGKNRIHVFEKSLETKVIKNHQLENDLRLALKNKEINMVYQPIVNSESLNMVGSEILLRWQHPTEGVIMPTDFIPIAESAQLILEIGYWTIEKACQQIIKWQANTKSNFFIAVNLSVVQIRDEGFLNKITDLIYKYKIPRNFLEFEVTESILLSESTRSIEIINQLKLMGIKLSIDDFGTGYSSFDYIRKLPLDKIKIDKSFIQDIPSDSNSVTIVKTILNMANEMNLEVVAEGVETDEQIEFLRQHNCQFFQGFYFSKPKSVELIQQQFKF